MDSLTQFALGAAFGEITLGRKIGRLAPVLGGICGTLPDLDVFYSYGDPISDFTYHRGVTHSLFVLAVAAPVVAETLRLIFRKWHDRRLAWYLMVYLALLTHPVLDAFTIYGTQLLWPFDTTPVSWATLFIIDPAYTLPLVVSLIIGLAVGRMRPIRTRAVVAALCLSTAYLGWSIYAKGQAQAMAREAIAAAGLEPSETVTVPGPFTSALWRVTAVDDEHYHNAYFSMFDPDGYVPEFVSHPRGMKLLDGIRDTWAVKRLAWFSHGIYAVSQVGDAVAIRDLRMGLEPSYVFNFKVGTISNPHARPLEPAQQFSTERDLSAFGWVWDRLWSHQLPPRP